MYFTKTNPRVRLGEGVRITMVNESRATSKKTGRFSVFAMALVASLALAAVTIVPQTAAASPLTWGPTGGSFPWKYYVATSNTVLDGYGEPYSCAGGEGKGEQWSATSGFQALTLTECKLGTGVRCTSPGKSSGTIATSLLSVTPVYLDAAHTKFGLKLSPAEGGTFAEFSCGGNPKTWNGSLIGQITNPGLGVTTKVFTLSFVSTGSEQNYQQIEGSGPKYHLTENISGFIFNLGVNATHTLSAESQGLFQ